MSQPHWQILANMGKPLDIREPPGVEHLYPDPATSLPVYLIVWGEARGIPVPERHWAICWKVGVASNQDTVYRILQLTRERGPYGLLNHLTNWGPKTKVTGAETRQALSFLLGVFYYHQRQFMEQLACVEPVVVPNGWWTCQHWIVSILVKCIQSNLLNKYAVQELLAKAGWTTPLNTSI